MNIKTVCSILLLAVCGSLAHAGPVTHISLVADSFGGQSAGISKTHTTAGLFTDVYVLDGNDGFALLDGILQTTGGPSAVDIDFFSASINGVNFDFTRTDQRGAKLFINFREIGVFAETGLNSPFTLTITGRAGEGLADGAAINATYSGTINVNAIPEPASAALAVTGLLAAGLVSRRRKAK